MKSSRKPTRKPAGKPRPKPGSKKFVKKRTKPAPILKSESDGIRLNKFLSNAGICSRREADVIISTGVVSINKKVVTELGVKVMPGDEVRYDGSLVKQEQMRYVLVNKPKNTLAVIRDPKGRRSILQVIKGACREAIFPVGRLDKDALGLILVTNDGDLAKKLANAKHAIPQLFHVTVSQKVKQEDIDLMIKGFKVEEIFIQADEIEVVAGNRKQLGVMVKTGRSRVVERMFEARGYDISKIDRVMYANLTKKDLPRGEWRFLSEKEVAFLKMLR